MEHENLQNLAINMLTMRHEVLLRALCTLVRKMPQDTRAAFASELRPQLIALMEAAAELSHPDVDAIVLLDMRKLEEAAGEQS